jgi:hypothetical protein
MLRRLSCLGLLAFALWGAGVARAAPLEPCPLLFVPEGYRMICEIPGDPAREWRLTVRPEDELAAPFSLLSLGPVAEPVEDPDIWLREQLTLKLSAVGDAFRDLVDRPGSPLFDPALASSLDEMVGQLRVLDQLPLQSCGFPAMTASEDAWQIECAWGVGPIALKGLLRLAYRDDQPYAISIYAMSDRRMRHLVAIANSF